MGKKSVNEQELKKLMEKLDLTEDEAMELIAFDNEEIDNEEAAQLEEKAKAAKSKTKRSPLEKVKNMKKKKVVDADKENIMAVIKNMVNSNTDIFINAQQLTPTKITFMLHGNYYTISLTKHKKMPDGYHVEG